jgi:hypothetical protein
MANNHSKLENQSALDIVLDNIKEDNRKMELKVDTLTVKVDQIGVEIRSGYITRSEFDTALKLKADAITMRGVLWILSLIGGAVLLAIVGALLRLIIK